MNEYVRAKVISTLIHDKLAGRLDFNSIDKWVQKITMRPKIENLDRQKSKKTWIYEVSQFLDKADAYFTNQKIDELFNLAKAKAKAKAEEKAKAEAEAKKQAQIEYEKRVKAEKLILSMYQHDTSKWKPFDEIVKDLNLNVGEKTLKAKSRKMRIKNKWLYFIDDIIEENYIRGPAIFKSTVIERGWTKGMIDKYLGDPDRYCRNPHYSSMSIGQLYLVDRVEKMEKLPEVQEKIKERLAFRNQDDWESAHI